MIRIRHIDVNDPLYAQARDLAARVAQEGESARETRALFGAIKAFPSGDRLVGCVAVRASDDPSVGLLEWFAVDPQLQGQALGRRLLAEAETEAFARLGLARLVCDAPKRAKAFLSRMGWRESDQGGAEDGRIRMEVAAEAPGEDVAGPADLESE